MHSVPPAVIRELMRPDQPRAAASFRRRSVSFISESPYEMCAAASEWPPRPAAIARPEPGFLGYPDRPTEAERLLRDALAVRRPGLGRLVALHYRAPTSYQ